MTSFFAMDKEDLRARLSVREVAAQLRARGARAPAIQADGTALCPFHDDHEESFYLYKGSKGFEEWWCQPCGFGGDLFDLVMRSLSVPFPEARDVCEEMYQALPPGYVPPVEQRRFEVNMDYWVNVLDQAKVRSRRTENAGLIALNSRLVDQSEPDALRKALAYDDHLREWGWRLDADGSVLSPHADAYQQVTGCKVRTLDGRKRSLPGSKYPHLYGAWRGRRFERVLLVEGESDAVYASFLAAQEGELIDVFALPSGAQQPPTAEHMSFLGNPRELYLAFDPDPAGVQATQMWIDALLQNGISSIRVCRLPYNRDLREARPVLRDLLAHAKAPRVLPNPRLQEVQGINPGYAKADADGNMTQVTDWIVRPYTILTEPDNPGFQVVVESRHHRSRRVLRLSDLANNGALNRWANRNGALQFLGSDADRKMIAEHVEVRGSIVPEVFSTTQVGAHEPPPAYAYAGPSVVYADPDTYLGKMPFTYVPTERFKEVRPDELLLPVPEGTPPFLWNYLTDFLALSSPEVTHPLLAWLVASVRRREVSNFPLLFIGGSSGVGKSTLAVHALRLLGSAITTDLGSVTPFVLVKTLASTTNIPIFVDEWTRLSRQDTREAFQSNITALYSGGLAERGQADLTTTSYPMTAPVIVAGEDTFKLTREKDRTVVIYPSKPAQNHLALHRIEGAPLQRFGDLLHRYVFGDVLRGPLPPFGAPADSRPEYNEGILLSGWATLRDLLSYHAQFDATVPAIPDVPDLSALHRADDEEDTYRAAVHAGLAYKDTSGNPVAWIDPSGIGTWIRAEALVMAVERNTDIKPPGSKTALLNYFREEYGEAAVRYDKNARPPGYSKRLGATLICGFLPQDPDVHDDYFNGGE